MSDSSKYVNTYIEVAVGTVHELLNQVLQLKTEARISNDLVSERDQVISSLESEKEQLVSSFQNEKEQISASLEQERERTVAEHAAANQANENARVWEGEVNSLRNKAENFDLLSNQFNELKRDFIAKDTELEAVRKELEDTLEKLKELQKIDRQAKKEEKKSQVVTAKPIINKETTPAPVVKSNTAPVKVVVPKIEETDDF